MNWSGVCVNHSEKKLINSTQMSFAMIRRDSEARVSQIQWLNPATARTEWIDLKDYRYGMSPNEVNEDIEISGIRAEEWAFQLKVEMRAECKKFNDSKLSPCFYYTAPSYYQPPVRPMAK
jgi:hypothetical protein